MYYLTKMSSTVRVPPKYFGSDLKKTLIELLREEFESFVDEETGVIISIVDIVEVGDGKIIHGDGAAWYDTVFNTITYKPLMHEIVEGKITEITEFGAFILIGPIEGLIHVSQTMDDFISYNPKIACFTGKESKFKLARDDNVKAKIINISLKGNIANSKIGLTMRQVFLGKEEWIEKQLKELNKKKKKKVKEKSKKK